jgi:ABC-2 type transport system ATP-binding protein
VGRTAESGSFNQLRHLTRTSVVVDTARPLDAVGLWPGVHDARVKDGHAEFSVEHGELNRVLEHLVPLEVRSMVTSPPSLEELFMRHYDEDVAVPARDADAGVVRAR